uniref:Uncharacterized protein n=1 Tax=Oryza punctata TaxID=4537 RepID=A0A0E0KS00_ORYPU
MQLRNSAGSQLITALPTTNATALPLRSHPHSRTGLNRTHPLPPRLLPRRQKGGRGRRNRRTVVAAAAHGRGSLPRPSLATVVVKTASSLSRLGRRTVVGTTHGGWSDWVDARRTTAGSKHGSVVAPAPTGANSY